MDIDLEISQLNRIIIFKDQIIVVMNNEIQKLRKELSDLSILNGYDGVPAGRYSRFKKTTESMAVSPYDSTKTATATDTTTVEEIVENFENIKNCDTDKILNFNNNNNNEQMNNNNNIIDNDEIIQTFIHNIKNDKIINTIDIEKKIFLNSQICNISDEDKTNLVNLNNSNNINKNNLPDITLNLVTKNNQQQLITNSSLNLDALNNSSEDDDFKSLTPIKDIEELVPLIKDCSKEDNSNEEDVMLEIGILKNDTRNAILTKTQHKSERTEPENFHILEIERLQSELEDYKNNFERERMKWADEKEKVLIYQRQLQNNYLEVLNKTNVLEEKLRNVEVL